MSDPKSFSEFLLSIAGDVKKAEEAMKKEEKNQEAKAPSVEEQLATLGNFARNTTDFPVGTRVKLNAIGEKLMTIKNNGGPIVVTHKFNFAEPGLTDMSALVHGEISFVAPNGQVVSQLVDFRHFRKSQEA